MFVSNSDSLAGSLYACIHSCEDTDGNRSPAGRYTSILVLSMLCYVVHPVFTLYQKLQPQTGDKNCVLPNQNGYVHQGPRAESREFHIVDEARTCHHSERTAYRDIRAAETLLWFVELLCITSILSNNYADIVYKK